MLRLTTAVLAVCASASQALASDAERTVRNDADTGIQTFTPDSLARFAPQTGRDLLRQVPGFSIRRTSGGRGLGQGGVNVLIDGERVTSKDTDALDILERTPVAAVVRIEVADAAALGVTGLTGQVANVVLDRTVLSGSFRYSPEFREGVKPRLTNGAASLSGQAHGVDFTLGFENDSHRGFEEGIERVLGPDGSVIDVKREHLQVQAERPRATVALGGDLGPKTSFSLSGSASAISYEERERSELENGDLRRALNSEDEWNADLSAELSREIGPGTLKTIAYQRVEHSPFFNRAGFAGLDVFDRTIFEQTIDEGETIGRLEYAWADRPASSWEVAAETAFNVLDREAVLTEGVGPDAAATVFPDRRVEELRSQGSLTRGMTLFGDLSLQASAAAEWSRLSVSGDGEGREQDFFRPKGFVSVAYPVAEGFDVRGRVAREVGQLNFFDFITSVNLTEDRATEGNTALVPQQSWDGEIEFERSFGSDEKVIVRIEGSLIEDRVDRVLVPVPDGEGGTVLRDAVGNIEEASFAAVSAEGTFFTDRWHVPGGRFDFGAVRRTSSLEDPLTGESRNFSSIREWSYDLDFRHDIPNTDWAWGAGVSDSDEQVLIRFDEVTVFDRTRPFVRAFVEHKDLFGFNLRVRGGNLANTDYTIERTRYAELRDGPVDIIESRSRIDNQRLTVTLSTTF